MERNRRPVQPGRRRSRARGKMWKCPTCDRECEHCHPRRKAAFSKRVLIKALELAIGISRLVPTFVCPS
jgi:hypothetical protein